MLLHNLVKIRQLTYPEQVTSTYSYWYSDSTDSGGYTNSTMGFYIL